MDSLGDGFALPHAKYVKDTMMICMQGENSCKPSSGVVKVVNKTGF
jgi:hypothetical protein